MAPITLYTWPTPNGIKASITLEELGLQYKAEGLNIATNIQKEEYDTMNGVSRSIIITLRQLVPEDKPQWPHSCYPRRRPARV